MANFTEKKIIRSPAREKLGENPPDEATLDNIRNEILEECIDKPETVYNDVWANFDSKKIISCNPRPTLDEIYLDHKRPQPPHTETKRESIEKKVVFQDAKRRKALEKEEEYCLNLGTSIIYSIQKALILNIFRNSVKLDQGPSPGEVSVRQQDELPEELHHPAEDEVQTRAPGQEQFLPQTSPEGLAVECGGQDWLL